MLRAVGDIWNLPLKYWIVIPTNIGWKKDGTNVMGRGLAAQAAKKYPLLSAIYGKWCMEYALRSSGDIEIITYLPRVREQHNLLLFPTKPLNVTRPHASWQSKSDLGLIEASLEQLAKHTMHVAVPLVGCGNGGLKESQVLPLMEKYLVGDNFLYIAKE